MLKKRIVPFVLVSFSLIGCITEVSNETAASSVTSPDEIMTPVAEVDNKDSRPTVALDFDSGVNWTKDGYAAYPSEDEIYTISGHF